MTTELKVLVHFSPQRVMGRNDSLQSAGKPVVLSILRQTLLWFEVQEELYHDPVEYRV